METDNDLKLGEILGAPFHVDREQWTRWGRPGFVVDVAPGEAGGFSLEGSEGVHFVSRALLEGEAEDGDRAGDSSPLPTRPL